MSPGLVDWSRPWWRDWRAWVQPVWEDWKDWGDRQGGAAAKGHGGAPLHEVLNRYSREVPVRFVPQSELPHGQPYEDFIFRQRQVPTRDNLHDLFNGCCWSRFPLTKTRLNALQAEVIGCEGVGARRGPVRDALTLFDENALLLQVPPRLWEALRQHDWTTVLVEHRQDWLGPQGIRTVVFGHALLEKLCQPYKSITAHAYWIDPALPRDDQAWDAWLAARLQASHLVTKPFQPLPVMGIPGWCESNAQPHFYADVQVFRPVSQARPTPP